MSSPITFDVREIRNKLPRILDDVAKKQIPMATATALTRVAIHAWKQAKAEMKLSFDKPTPYALNSVIYNKATKKRLFAEIDFNDKVGKGAIPAERFLVPNIYGVNRRLKRFEVALQKRGILPSGYWTHPGKEAKLDAYGNQSNGEIIEVLSALGAAETISGYLMNRTEASKKRNKKLRNFFAIRSRGGFFGIMERRGKKTLRRIMSFGKTVPKYEEKFPYVKIATEGWESRFIENFGPALEQAIATSGTKGKWSSSAK